MSETCLNRFFKKLKIFAISSNLIAVSQTFHCLHSNVSMSHRFVFGFVVTSDHYQSAERSYRVVRDVSKVFLFAFYRSLRLLCKALLHSVVVSPSVDSDAKRGNKKKITRSAALLLNFEIAAELVLEKIVCRIQLTML